MILTTISAFMVKNAATILTFTGVATGVGAAVIAVKESENAAKIIDEAKEKATSKSDRIIKTVFATIKAYKFSILTGGLAILQIAIGHKIALNRLATAGAAAYLYKNRYEDLKSKVDNVLTEKQKCEIRESIANEAVEKVDNDTPRETKICRDEEDLANVKTFVLEDLSTSEKPLKFRATLREVEKAEAEISSTIRNEHSVSICEITNLLGLGSVDGPVGELEICAGSVGLTGSYKDNFEFNRTIAESPRTGEYITYLSFPAELSMPHSSCWSM